MYVRLMRAFAANFSWENPRSDRRRRTALPNATDRDRMAKGWRFVADSSTIYRSTFYWRQPDNRPGKHARPSTKRIVALKPCRECGQEISGEAKTCPHCGKRNPTGRKTSPIALGCLVLIVGTVVIDIAVTSSSDSSTTRNSVATQPARSNAPSSSSSSSPSKSAKTTPPAKGTLTCYEEPGTRKTTCVVGSSRVDLQACKLEYSIVSPK